MFLRTLFLSTIILLTHFATADETADKAEFKKLYAEFNELYANSEAIDPIIEVAKKLYKIAPRAYGKNHQNTAVVIYNLAALYHEKAEKSQTFYGTYQYLQHNSEGKKSVEYYERYFNIIDNNGALFNRSYFDQYFKFIKADTIFNGYKSDVSRVNKLILIAKKINLPIDELANLNYTLGTLRIKAWQNKQAKPFFQTAYDLATANNLDNHLLIGKSAYWLALMAAGEKETTLAENYFLKALEILSSVDENKIDLVTNIHFGLANLYFLERSLDKAAKHGQKYSAIKQFGDDKAIPVVKIQPEFPRYITKRHRDEFVELEFTVDVNGKPQNILVAESSRDLLNEHCIEAMKKFRFLPRWENDERTEINGIKYKFIFPDTKSPRPSSNSDRSKQ